MELLPYESVFLAADGLLGGFAGESVTTAYRQLGFSPDAAASSPDHLGYELAALAHLCQQEAKAIQEGSNDKVALARQLQGRFLQDHLLPWLIPFHLALKRQADPFYTAVSNLCLSLVHQHFTGLETDSRHPVQWVVEAWPSNDLLDEERSGLREICDFLMVPILSGLYLSRADIGRLGRQLQLPRGFGDRSQTMLNLMRTAAQYEQFAALISGIREVVTDWLAGYHQMREAMPELTPFVIPWEERARQTRGLLSNLEDQAGEVQRSEG
jgi:hypothetical protein